ncbi:ROK family protein [Mollicutes bacterium LVI A0078]|nr:ROK family protein [Mollicutes bacterium LVI A0075]WOO90379.1 ROK family protein [Mollicutes bacterium LVI A0078]
MNILVIDIGGSSIKYADFSIDGILLKKSSFDVPQSFNLLIEKIEEIYNGGNYSAISISSPGAIDTATGQGYGLTAIDYIPRDGNLKSTLESRLNVPVAIDNDANCAGLSEVHFAEDLDSIAYVVLGSGVGGCVIIDGNVVTGSKFFGGEFGYMPYKDSTYSMYAGMLGLSQRATGQSDTVVPGLTIFEQYENGNIPYVNAVNEYYGALASLISILKHTIDPDQIIWSGAVTNRATFIDELQTAINHFENGKDYIISDVDLAISRFGSDANLYGAYANLIRNYSI